MTSSCSFPSDPNATLPPPCIGSLTCGLADPARQRLRVRLGHTAEGLLAWSQAWLLPAPHLERRAIRKRHRALTVLGGGKGAPSKNKLKHSV